MSNYFISTLVLMRDRQSEDLRWYGIQIFESIESEYGSSEW